MRRTTLFTCSIYPDLTRVWYHYARRYTDISHVAYIIYDCGSRLCSQYFPDASIFKHPNVDHGRKIDHCTREAVNTPLVFLSDDDSFILSEQAEMMAAKELIEDETVAAFSFKPRGWWEFEIAGVRYPVMGSYSLVFKPDVVRKENLSFRTCPTQDSRIRKGSGYFDTADYANMQLLLRGYKIIVPGKEIRSQMVRSFSAVSSGFVNFARRKWLSELYRPSKSLRKLGNEINFDLRKLEWACGVAAVVSLYRTLFGKSPQFESFFCYDDLYELASSDKDESSKKSAIDMVLGYKALLNFLESRA